jgi:hypothetical protein
LKVHNVPPAALAASPKAEQFSGSNHHPGIDHATAIVNFLASRGHVAGGYRGSCRH